MKKIVFITLTSLLLSTSCYKKVEPAIEESFAMSNIVEIERTGDELKIVANIWVKPEALKTIMPVFETMVKASQQEDGCIFYNLHKDTSDSTKFVMLEEWESQAAIDFHNQTDHMKAFKAATKDLVQKSEVSILKLVY